MKKLLNTLYITKPNTYLRLDGENIVIEEDENILGKLPLINFESIVYFGYPGASPKLLGYCAEKNIPICFLTKNGRFLARVNGEYHGNIILRKKQYLISEDKKQSVLIARNFIFGKVANQKFVLDKFCREYNKRIDISNIQKISNNLNEYLKKILICEDLEKLRGYEGYCATLYFSVFNDLILVNKDIFYFNERTKRPPLDNVNAMLSFLYTLLSHEVSSGLETVGLDPYCGFLHADRAGRISLALDLMEEMRPVIVDRFVITLINKQIVKETHFEKKENGAVYFTEDGKRIIIEQWQKRKTDEIIHPFLDEKINYGLIPYTQSLLLSRMLRDDIPEYPPFLWR